MIYNNNYNFHKSSQEGLETDYSFYIYGELLYNNKLAKIDRFKKKYILSIIKYISLY
jgi:hypothetical protein